MSLKLVTRNYLKLEVLVELSVALSILVTVMLYLKKYWGACISSGCYSYFARVISDLKIKNNTSEDNKTKSVSSALKTNFTSFRPKRIKKVDSVLHILQKSGTKNKEEERIYKSCISKAYDNRILFLITDNEKSVGVEQRFS